ncbi:MAG: DUF2235 domain-containing protein [Paracoccaceae bacterium]
MGKNIVIFSDGTGQDGGVGPDSNVYKLFKSIENRTQNQIAFYDSGLGTELRPWTGKLGGAGITKNILECYQFIFDNFEVGDQIYLFGFSRGAATVRSLSSFIEAFGILPKSRRKLISQAYEIYKTKDKGKRQNKTDDFHDRHHTMWTKVKFLGVWDTVAALGVPFPVLDRIIDTFPILKHRFHNFRISRGVEFAYHALSIDEKRRTFLPTLFDEEVIKGQHLEQMWFAGVHSDIGGGYAQTALSDIALNWMVKNAVNHGLQLFSDEILEFEGYAVGPMHNSVEGWSRFLRRTERFWPKTDGNNLPRGKPNIHPSVLIRARDEKGELSEKYDPWILKL